MKIKCIAVFVLLAFISFKPAAQSTLPDSSDYIYEKVDVEPSYPGGDAGWQKFLAKNINGSVPVEKGAPVGIYNVEILFLIDKDGKIIEMKPVTEYGFGMEEEVMKALKKSPKWIPATVNGRPVKTWKKQPASFLCESEDFEVSTTPAYTLYTGKENIVMITVRNVGPQILTVTISGGSVVPLGENGFVIRVDTPGEAVIELYNKQKNKRIGAAHFTVEKFR